MTKLNLLDQIFYKLDKAGLAQVYMGGAVVIDASATAPRLTGQDIIEHLIARFEAIPVLHKKIVEDPLKLGNMQLVDAPDFNIRDHFSLTVLDAPGNYEQLTQSLEQFSVRSMDFNRPLWRYEIIEGLEDGRIAIASHLHHALMDGEGAIRTLASIFDQEPLPPETPSDKPWKPEEPPSAYKMIVEGLVDITQQLYYKTPLFLKENRRNLATLSRQLLADVIRPKEDDEPAKQQAHNPTSLDAWASGKAFVAFKIFPLEEIKALRQTLGYTINELSLFITSVTLEHYFKAIGEKVNFDLVAAMPVSVRTEEDSTTGNLLSGGTICLHNSIANHSERLEALHRSNEEVKQSSRNSDGLNPASFMDILHPALLDLAMTALSKVLPSGAKLPVNTVLSNVAGPRGQTYIAGAPLVYTIPMLPRVVGLSCGITSSGNSFSIGFHGCAKAVKDKNLLTEGVDIAINALQELAENKRGQPQKRAGECAQAASDGAC